MVTAGDIDGDSGGNCDNLSDGVSGVESILCSLGEQYPGAQGDEGPAEESAVGEA